MLCDSKTLSHAAARLLLYWSLVLLPAVTSAQPGLPAFPGSPRLQVQEVLHGAGFRLGGLAPSIVRGGRFVITGQGLGPDNEAEATIPLPTQLPAGGTGTAIAVQPQSGSPVAAFIVSTSARRIEAVLPSAVPAGPANLTVSYNGVTSQPVPINILDRGFGIFTANKTGGGPALARFVISDDTQPGVTLTSPARFQNTIAIRGTGLGPIDRSDNETPAHQTFNVDVQVQLGDKSIRPSFAGRSADQPGVDEIRFVMPEGVPNGCYIPLSVRIGFQASNTATLPVASTTGACIHPLGLSQQKLENLDAGGSLKIASIGISRFSLPGFSMESAGGAFSAVASGDLYEFSGANNSVSQGALPTCIVVPPTPHEDTDGDETGQPDLTPVPSAPARAPVGLDAGEKLLLTGPNGQRKDVPRVPNMVGLYSTGIPDPLSMTAPQPFLAPGNWKFTGPGGKDIAAFSAETGPSALITWSNKEGLSTVDRNRDLVVNWSGGSDRDVVTFFGAVSTKPDPGSPAIEGGFFCMARASDHTLTVPGSMVSQMPARTGSPSEKYEAFLMLAGGSSVNFTAALTTGENLDAATLNVFSDEMMEIEFR